jgi:hypothetical protein
VIPEPTGSTAHFSTDISDAFMACKPAMFFGLMTFLVQFFLFAFFLVISTASKWMTRF